MLRFVLPCCCLLIIPSVHSNRLCYYKETQRYRAFRATAKHTHTSLLITLMTVSEIIKRCHQNQDSTCHSGWKGIPEIPQIIWSEHWAVSSCSKTKSWLRSSSCQCFWTAAIKQIIILVQRIDRVGEGKDQRTRERDWENICLQCVYKETGLNWNAFQSQSLRKYIEEIYTVYIQSLSVYI